LIAFRVTQTDPLVIARDMQRAGAGLRSIVESVVDTKSDLPSLSLPCLASPRSFSSGDVTLLDPAE